MMAKITDKEFNAALPVMQKLLWADPQDRERLQNQGLNITPSNFYSSTPSISEIKTSYEYYEPEPPYLDCGLFDNEALQANLIELIPYSDEFAPAEMGDQDTCTSYFWKNGQFTCTDATAYYAFVRSIRPKNIVEIGSGFSSLIALEALNKNKVGRLRCIEPFPRPFITSLADKGTLDLQAIRAQDLTAEMLNSCLEDGDILFIDSTHTVKTGSDCLHIYLRLLPKITKKIYVHVHDVFLPFGLPQRWLIDHQIYWTEQYLLLALMIDNPRTRLLFGSAYHQHFSNDLLTELMRGRAANGGASFWFEFDGRLQTPEY
ncbi:MULTISPECIES: class I SAM-dependent methyltransferase [Pseudomonas]|uniref:class I SAM-dependent methyltransferase n=1 Tax=Pseudomonas TaxID=286 RepID=UPI000B824B74|nr:MULTISPECIES: class I SAM-dependent methyltransferase [Pseudomonas]